MAKPSMSTATTRSAFRKRWNCCFALKFPKVNAKLLKWSAIIQSHLKLSPAVRREDCSPFTFLLAFNPSLSRSKLYYLAVHCQFSTSPWIFSHRFCQASISCFCAFVLWWCSKSTTTSTWTCCLRTAVTMTTLTWWTCWNLHSSFSSTFRCPRSRMLWYEVQCLESLVSRWATLWHLLQTGHSVSAYVSMWASPVQCKYIEKQALYHMPEWLTLAEQMQTPCHARVLKNFSKRVMSFALWHLKLSLSTGRRLAKFRRFDWDALVFFTVSYFFTDEVSDV